MVHCIHCMNAAEVLLPPLIATNENDDDDGSYDNDEDNDKEQKENDGSTAIYTV